nr:ELM1/GtrOC1 family putative glycosyltransferase [uncultured Desulfuromonas sp.]
MKKIVVLMSKNHGSNQQLLSIARHVYSGYNLQKTTVGLISHAPILFPVYHGVIRTCKTLGGDHPVSRFLKRFILRNHPLQLNEGDIILAKTGRYEFPAQLLAAGSRAQTIYIGQPRRLNSNAFDCLVATPSTPSRTHHIFLDILPTPFSYNEFCALSPPRDRTLWAMLLGGNARGFSYDESTWTQLIDSMIQLAGTHHIRWRISTSPRTGREIETLLKLRFSTEKDSLAELVCWGDQQRKSVQDCLVGTDMAFVTEDSASMLCEALNSRLPIISIRPDAAGHNTLTTPLAEHHQLKGSLLRMTCSQLTAIDIPSWRNRQFSPLRQCWTEQWRKQIPAPNHKNSPSWSLYAPD